MPKSVINSEIVTSQSGKIRMSAIVVLLIEERLRMQIIDRLFAGKLKTPKRKFNKALAIAMLEK